MKIATMAATATAVGVLALAGCGSSGGGSESSGDRQDLIDAMVSEGATEEQATCVVDDLGDDARRLYEADENDLSEEDVADLVEAMTSCVDLEDLLDTATSTP